MKKMKSILLFIIALIITGCHSLPETTNPLKSLKQLDDGLFFFEYIGDYGFDVFLEQGGAKVNEDIAKYLGEFIAAKKYISPAKDEKSNVRITIPDFGCSSIVAKKENGDAIFGRNYDWMRDSSAVIIHTKPDSGYESISTSSLEFIGLKRNWKPNRSHKKNEIILACIYVPLDGMNEKGLYISNLVAGDKEKTAQNTGKTSVTTTTAIRLVLDKAATVDEAIALLENHDMHSVIGFAHHFAIADASGKSVAVEWVDNKMYVSETKVLTNFYVTESPKKGQGCQPTSYNCLKELGDKNNWILDANQIRDGLKDVKYKTTWSCVYEPSDKRITYYLRENFNKPIKIEF